MTARDRAESTPEAGGEVGEAVTLAYHHEHPDVRLTDADVAEVTKAIGSSIDGFNFEMTEASWREPGVIKVYGQVVESGNWFDVTLRVIEANEVYPDFEDAIYGEDEGDDDE